MTDFRTVPIPESEVLRHALAKADAEIAGLTARAEAAERERDALRQQAAADLEAMATFSESERRCRGERDESRQTRDEALLALGAVHAACDGHASRGRGDRTETAAERVRAIVAVKEDSARLYLSSMQVRTAERDAEREQFTAERAAFWAVVNERNEAREQRDAERAAGNEWLAKLHDARKRCREIATRALDDYGKSDRDSFNEGAAQATRDTANEIAEMLATDKEPTNG